MPTVPFAAPTVRESPADTTQRNVRTSADTFAPDLTPAARVANEIMVKEKQKVDDSRVLEAERELLKTETDLTYNKDSGYLTKRGRDAENVVDTTLGQFDKVAGVLEQNLTNEDQRTAFRNRVKVRGAGFNERLQKYSFDERERYVEEQQNAYMADEQTAALQIAPDLASKDTLVAGQARDRISSSLVRQMDTLVMKAQQDGKSVDWLRAETLKASSAMHVGVLEGLMGTGNVAVVEAYYAANKDDIDPRVTARLQKAIKETGFRGRAQQTFDEITTSTPDAGKRLDKVAKIKDPELRDEVQQRVVSQMNIDRVVEREQADDVFLSAVNAVEKAKSVSVVNPAVWSTFDLNQRNALRSMESRLTPGGAVGESDPATWLNFLDMSAVDKAKLTPAQFHNQFRPKLADREFNMATTQWNAAREASRNPKPGALSSIQSDTDIVKGAFSLGLGKPSNAWDDDNKLEFIRFTDDAAARINAFEEQKGTKATADEKQKITNSLMVKVHIKKSFLGIDSLSSDVQKRLSDVSPEDLKTAYIPIAEIPQSDTDALVNLARSYGLAGKMESTTAIRQRLGGRIERAYAAIRLGQSKADISAILKGRE